MKILFIGCGDIGQRVATQLKDNHQCFGLRRDVSELPSYIQPIAADAGDEIQLRVVFQQAFDAVIVTMTPDTPDVEGYNRAYLRCAKNLKAIINQTEQRPQRVIWVSSTGVYQDQEDWIDESSPVKPKTATGSILLQAEQQVRGLDCATSIVRFSGIYGPHRLSLLNSVKRGIGRPSTPAQWSNRIHIEDCCGFLCHLITLLDRKETVRPLYIATDNEPVTQHNLRKWLAAELGVSLIEEAVAHGSHRRYRNRALTDSGYRLKYPSFSDGYRELIALLASPE